MKHLINIYMLNFISYYMNFWKNQFAFININLEKNEFCICVNIWNFKIFLKFHAKRSVALTIKTIIVIALLGTMK